MVRYSLTAFTLLLFSSLCYSQVGEWKSLFNGKDLSGWVDVNSAPETFTATDYMIVCSGKPTSVMRTEKQYENFVLEVEWRHMKASGNAGIFIWSEGISAPGTPFAKGVEVQVLENAYGGPNKPKWFTSHGDIFPIHGSSMVPDNPRGGDRSFPLEERSKPHGNWNKYVIVCVDGVVKLSVNGKFVTGGSKCNYKKGYICLESEGSECHFRNLRILELPGGVITDEQIAPIAKPHRLIYTGLDLRNWQVNAAVKKMWKPSGWQLKAKAAGNDGKTELVSDRKYTNYSVIFDYKWDKKNVSPETSPIRLGKGGNWGFPGDLPDALKAALANPPKARNAFKRIMLSKRNGKLSISINGQEFVKDADIGSTGPEEFALKNNGIAASFCGVYVMEL